MSTIQGIQLLVKSITALSNSLPKSLPNGTTGDKIWAVMHTQEGETPFETFNKRFDAMFGEDCRDVDGRLHYIRQGNHGMGLVCTYLNKIKWTSNFPLDLVEIKLLRLKTELIHLKYAFTIFTFMYTEPVSGVAMQMSHLSLRNYTQVSIKHGLPDLSKMAWCFLFTFHSAHFCYTSGRYQGCERWEGTWHS
jgi:hypothetical protein